jgi:hypothetical protein
VNPVAPSSTMSYGRSSGTLGQPPRMGRKIADLLRAPVGAAFDRSRYEDVAAACVRGLVDRRTWSRR